MREEMGLYKAKRKDTGKWIQGYLFCIWEKAYILWGTTNGIPDMVEVDPETVCEWTGLVDKNRVQIFEMDIVKDIDGTRLVCWDEEKAAFVIRSQEFPYETLYLEEMWEDNEVIGSIHDKAVEG